DTTEPFGFVILVGDDPNRTLSPDPLSEQGLAGYESEDHRGGEEPFAGSVEGSNNRSLTEHEEIAVGPRAMRDLVKSLKHGKFAAENVVGPLQKPLLQPRFRIIDTIVFEVCGVVAFRQAGRVDDLCQRQKLAQLLGSLGTRVIGVRPNNDATAI